MIRSLWTSKLSRAFVGTFLVRILSVGGTFLCSVLLARSLGVENFGIFSYILAIVTIIALPAQAGMPTLVLRNTAKANALKDWSNMKGLWIWCTFSLIIISTTVLILAIPIKITFFPDSLKNVNDSLFILAIIMAILIAMGQVRGAALRGLGKVILGQIPENLIRPYLIIIMVTLGIWLNIDFQPTSAMLIYLTAAIIAFIIGTYLLLREKPEELKHIRPTFNTKYWSMTLLPLAMMTGIQSLSSQIDIIMLGILTGANDVGIYKIVVSGSALTVFGLQVVNTVISPRLAAAFAKDDLDDMQYIASLSSLVSFCLTLPIAFVFFYFGSQLLTLVYGQEYSIGYIALTIITIGHVINAFFGSSISILTMSSNENSVILGMTLSLLTNLTLNLYFIPKLGINGAALSITCSLIVWNLYLWISIKRKLGIDCTFFWYIKGRT